MFSQEILLQFVAEKLLNSLTKIHYSDWSYFNNGSNNALKLRFGHCQISSIVCSNWFCELATWLRICFQFVRYTVQGGP